MVKETVASLLFWYVYGLFGKSGSKEFAQKKGDVIYCEVNMVLNVHRNRTAY